MGFHDDEFISIDTIVHSNMPAQYPMRIFLSNIYLYNT